MITHQEAAVDERIEDHILAPVSLCDGVDLSFDLLLASLKVDVLLFVFSLPH
jgi:hypothetical protein